jgi:hypothetical protein
VLAHCDLDERSIDWAKKGHDTAIDIALSCTRPEPADLPIGCQVTTGKESDMGKHDNQAKLNILSQLASGLFVS